jgi:hypothetical protein
MSDLVDWPAPERNKDPILEVLRRVLPERGTVLEVASATGQHIAHFAAALPLLAWQPSDVTDEHLRNLVARCAHAALQNLLPPIRLDVTDLPWPVGSFEAIYCANMIHISPWQTMLGLFQGAERALGAGAPLITYGPYAIDGKHVSDSNAAFDESLRSRNPEWGVRDMGDVTALAESVGLSLVEIVEMPANNLVLVFAQKQTR